MLKNDLDKLYQELGEHICLYPFFGAFYQTNNVIPIQKNNTPNSIRPCSIIMSSDMNKWNMQDQSIIQSRNSSAWIEIRRLFAEGQFHKIDDCRSCSYNEKSGTTSPRQMNNKFYAEFLNVDIIEETKKIIRNGYKTEDLITLDYYPSNYCNYSCIMCSGGASSQRFVFEINTGHQQIKMEINPADADFYDVLNKVEIINFTGGETVLQKEVHTIIDYLIEQDLASKILITLLTNASSNPNEMIEKFRKFKKVIYNVSIDGIGEVIEYQRRGCSWPVVEKNSLDLMRHNEISCVINYVLTAVNVLSFIDFVDWCWTNQILPPPSDQQQDLITISPVFRVDYLGVGALPPRLRELALEKLRTGRERYVQEDSAYHHPGYVRIIDRVIQVIESTPYKPRYLWHFVRHIALEDTVSKKSLVEVVPEWLPYLKDPNDLS